MKTSFVENKEFSFGTKIRGIGEACKPKVILSPNCHRTRIEAVTLFCDRIDNVRYHTQSRLFGKRIDPKPRWIGDQKHVRFINCRPAAQAGRIKSETLFKAIFRQL